ncbi:hypothetical protein F2Q70_00018170 [Brassica cretica]|uniref:Uncharacterized protein n=1 Tax=Brassica cretica TaxID=69181 RepID=A0A8S9I0S7_BRACR|nr:hypothetical protein F2Q70_00018170 [Brassica cretica]
MDEEMLNVDDIDDLMEEEQELEQERQTKANNSKMDIQPKKGLLVMKAREGITVDHTHRRSAEEVNYSSRTGLGKAGKDTGPEIERIMPGRRKKIPRSPDVKGTAASKKLAIRGRSSPRSKTSRQSRVPAARTSSKVARNEVADCLAKAARSRVDPFVSVSVETPAWLAHIAGLIE